jgi:hypothetical protein
MDRTKPVFAGIFKQSMGARNRAGIGLSYWSARLHKLAESIPHLRKTLKVPSLCRNFSTVYGGHRNRVGIGLSYRPARLCKLAELIPWYRFIGSSLKV